MKTEPSRIVLVRSIRAPSEATSRQVVYEALCSDLELLAQPTMSAGTTS